nr:ThiF family adenylyltransferase [Sphaerochaetaceae bacterium]
MIDQFSRTSLVLGQEAVEKLKRSHVAVFGIGGVGGHAVEALVRSGVGKIDIIDNDNFSLTNINRQLFALH